MKKAVEYIEQQEAIPAILMTLLKCIADNLYVIFLPLKFNKFFATSNELNILTDPDAFNINW